MKVICLLIDSLKLGGKERVISQLASFFSGLEGHRVELIIYGSTRAMEYELPPEVQVHFPGFSYNFRWRSLMALKTMVFLRRRVKQLDPDTILSFGELWNSFVLLSLLGLPYPVYISDRCRPDKRFGFFHDTLRRSLYPRARCLIAQTEKAAGIYRKEFPKLPVKVIGNPIRKMALRAETHPGQFVLTVGRMIPTKHHLELMEVFLEIDKPGWKLIIVGGDANDSGLMENLSGWIHDRSAEDRILLEGAQGNIESYYAKSQLFAFTSSSEGFPNVIGEAMASGLPVVSFDCVAGPSDMISDGETGYLISLFDYRNFKTRLEQLMDDSELRERMGRKGREHIRGFDLENIGKVYLECILHEDSSA